MSEYLIYGLVLGLGFVLGALVANNNKTKTEKVIEELKDKIEDLKKEAKNAI